MRGAGEGQGRRISLPRREAENSPFSGGQGGAATGPTCKPGIVSVSGITDPVPFVEQRAVWNIWQDFIQRVASVVKLVGNQVVARADADRVTEDCCSHHADAAVNP